MSDDKRDPRHPRNVRINELSKQMEAEFPEGTAILFAFLPPIEHRREGVMWCSPLSPEEGKAMEDFVVSTIRSATCATDTQADHMKGKLR